MTESRAHDPRRFVRLDVQEQRRLRKRCRVARGDAPAAGEGREARKDHVGVLVCEQVSGGVEMVVGVSQDALFGPVVMAGLGGAVMALGGFVVNHADGLPIVLPIAAGLAAAAGLFVLAGATPAALGLLADMSEAFPSDRGAIMGLYSVFLGVGQIVGSLIPMLSTKPRRV